jgi:hypothetical protein
VVVVMFWRESSVSFSSVNSFRVVGFSFFSTQTKSTKRKVDSPPALPLPLASPFPPLKQVRPCLVLQLLFSAGPPVGTTVAARQWWRAVDTYEIVGLRKRSPLRRPRSLRFVLLTLERKEGRRICLLFGIGSVSVENAPL